MKKILVMGALGQIGSELVTFLKKNYGDDNVIASDIKDINPKDYDGIYEHHDCTDGVRTHDIVKKHTIGTIYNLPALLSATAEAYPQKAWDINLNGLFLTLEVARQEQCSVFTPSTIGAFGPTTPKKNTPQDTIMRPTTMYGVTKVAGELLCDYYFNKFGVDTRGVRYPGIISNKTLPGGGTTDYAVEIYYDAVKHQSYVCNLQAGTFLDMMYMPDAINAAHNLMLADPTKLKHRNCFNISAMSFDPELLAFSIRKIIPNFTLSYNINPVKQAIADSWPDNMDDSAARNEWAWKPEFDLDKMSSDMITVLSKTINN